VACQFTGLFEEQPLKVDFNLHFGNEKCKLLVAADFKFVQDVMLDFVESTYDVKIVIRIFKGNEETQARTFPVHISVQ